MQRRWLWKTGGGGTRRDAGASEMKGEEPASARPPVGKPASTVTEAQGTELRLLASKRMLSSTTKSDDLLKHY